MPQITPLTNYGNAVWPTAQGAESPYTWVIFQVMSNELNTPKVIICPADRRNYRTNFDTDMTIAAARNASTSYWVARDSDETQPLMLLAGDRSIGASSTSTGYGYSTDVSPFNGWAGGFGTNQLANGIGWTAKLHQNQGNAAFADGSVQQLSSSALRNAVNRSGNTNSPANYILMP